jgi:HEAT repeat protein
LRFLANFHLERLSFWLGFLAATLFWWLVINLRPVFGRARELLRARAQAARQGLTAGVELRFRQETLRRAQQMHLAAALFALDEVSQPPRLLAAPEPVQPGQSPLPEDIATSTLPHLPDWPELGAKYGAATLSPAEALSSGARLAITGEPGSGKTVALALLACQIARREASLGPLAGFVPLLVHAADLALPMANPADPLLTLIDALGQGTSMAAQPRLAEYLRQALADGRAILLLDGLDEFPAELVQDYVAYLEALLKAQPGLRVAVAAAPQCLDGLAAAGFYPLALAAWDERQRRTFTQQWIDLWERTTPKASSEERPGADPALLAAWLLADPAPFTPLEITLKTWAACAGDALGPSGADAIEAHLRRMTCTAVKARPALEKLAAQILNLRQPAPTRREAEAWIAEYEPPTGEAGQASALAEPITAPRILPGLIDSGMLHTHATGRLRLAHPTLTAALAAGAFAARGETAALLDRPAWSQPLAWSVQAAALQAIAAREEASSMVRRLLEKNQEPLQRELLAAGRWLGHVPESAVWRANLMRRLAGVVQQGSNLPAIRTRAAVALALVSGPGSAAGVAVLFRQMLAAPDPELRLLAALSLGILGDSKATDPLAGMLNDPLPRVQRAACLALVAIGSKPAMDAVAGILLHGDEQQRRAAAEALASHPEEGHPMLVEGSKLEDLLVRHAVISGLKRTRQPWALERLRQMQVEDEQWLVKNAASQAVEELNQPGVYIPQAVTPLHQQPWLIAFASERGIGVAPGRPARDLLLVALREGNEEQRLAALEAVRRSADPAAVPMVTEILYHSQGELCETAFSVLAHLDAAGVVIQ